MPQTGWPLDWMTATVGVGDIVGMGNGVGVGGGGAVALDVAAARPHAESSSIARSSVTQRNIGMGRIKHASWKTIASAVPEHWPSLFPLSI